MAAINPNWYSLNSARAYPLDDRATRTGDNGERLPNEILADLNLRFPRSYGEYAWLSSLTVTRTLVTATFLASTDPASAPSGFSPLAAVTIPKPIQIGRNYKIDGLATGVAGWIVFGSADELFSARFSTPQQGLLLPRCARSYFSPPVNSLVKQGVAQGLKGIVNLNAGSDIEIVSGERVIDGRSRQVIVIRLKSFSSARNVLDIYKGPCGARPETGNCNLPGVEFINTVGPDCDGNIQIQFPGDTLAAAYQGSIGGVVLDFPLGMGDACTQKNQLPDSTGKLPGEHDDACTSEYETAPSSDVFREVS